MTDDASRAAWGDTLSRRRIAFVLASVMLGMLLAALDQTVVGTALPRVIAELNGLQHYAWVATGYLLASAASMPIWGKLSDAFGRRRFFMVGMMIFIIGSALCGQSRTMTELIFFRAIQGLGAGAMMPIVQAIVGDIFPPAQRARWAGVLMSVWGLATIVGPLLGGWITDNIGWRWAFYVNLPVGVIALAFAALALPGHARTHRHKVDYFGSTLLVSAAVPLLLGLSWAGSEYPWSSPVIICLFVGSVLLWGAFYLREMRAAEPVLNPRSVQKLHLLGVGGGERHPVGGHVRSHHVPAAVRPGSHGKNGHELGHHTHAHDALRRRHEHRRRADPCQDRALQGHSHPAASPWSREGHTCFPG